MAPSKKKTTKSKTDKTVKDLQDLQKVKPKVAEKRNEKKAKVADMSNEEFDGFFKQIRTLISNQAEILVENHYPKAEPGLKPMLEREYKQKLRFLLSRLLPKSTLIRLDLGTKVFRKRKQREVNELLREVKSKDGKNKQ